MEPIQPNQLHVICFHIFFLKNMAKEAWYILLRSSRPRPRLINPGSTTDSVHGVSSQYYIPME